MGMLNRVLMPFLIVALPLAAMIAYVAYYFHEKNKFPPAPTPHAGQMQAVSFGLKAWPVFRGDAALTGVAEGTLPDALTLAWRFETDGAIQSTPIVTDGVVIFSSMNGRVYAVDLQTGQEKWWFKANDEIEASPLYAEGRVFFASAIGTFFAVDAEDGLVLWTFDAKGRILGSANTYVDAESGKRRIVFGSYDSVLYCLDAADGSLVWTYEAQSYINGTPAIADGKAIFGSCDGRLYVVPLADPEATQTIDIESYMAASPAVADGVVYAGNYDGLFIAASLERYEELWRFQQDNVAFVASPAVFGDYVLIGARDKKMYCLNRGDGSVVWTFASTAKIDSSPVVCGNRVVFGADNGRLTILDMSDGREIFTYALGKPISGAIAIADNTLLVGCEDGAVYAFRSAVP